MPLDANNIAWDSPHPDHVVWDDAPAPKRDRSSVLADMTKSAMQGLADSFSSMAGLPGDISNMVGAGMRKVGIPTRDTRQPLPDTVTLPGGDLGFGAAPDSAAVMKGIPGKTYAPQSPAGELTRTAVSFAPALAGGQASLGSKLLGRVLAPAAGATALGSIADANKDPNLHAALQVGGAVLGGGVVSGARSLRAALTHSDIPPELTANQFLAKALAEQNANPQTIEQNAIPNRGQLGAEAMGPTGVSMLATLGRRPGATGEALANVLKERSAAAPSRILQDTATATGIEPSAAVGNMDNIVKSGRVAASPLYDKAFAGGSIAPLQTQYENAFNDASRAAKEAQGRVNDATREMEMAQGRQQGTDNVYEQSSARTAEKEAKANLSQAQKELDHAESTKATVLDRLRTAQSDASSNAPGAVWNPRVQQFLDDPIVKQGIGKGLEIQRLESLAEGKRFDPTELGITGTAENGDPIVAKVPNMRLLDAGKRGLDAILESYRNPITRQLVLDERGRAIEAVRKSYLGELDSLNPDYKAARAASADYLSANSAFKTAGDHLLNPGTTAKQVSEYVANLNPANLEAYKGGIANRLFNQAQNGRLKPGALLTPSVQQKLAAALGPDQAAKLVQGAQQELQLAQSGNRMMPGTGSITSDVLMNAGDQDMGANVIAGAHAARALGHGLSGNIVGAVPSTVAALRHFAPDLLKTGGMNTEVRNALGKALMLPPQDLAARLKQLPQPVPQSASMLGRLLSEKR